MSLILKLWDKKYQIKQEKMIVNSYAYINVNNNYRTNTGVKTKRWKTTWMWANSSWPLFKLNMSDYEYEDEYDNDFDDFDDDKYDTYYECETNNDFYFSEDKTCNNKINTDFDIESDSGDETDTENENNESENETDSSGDETDTENENNESENETNSSGDGTDIEKNKNETQNEENKVKRWYTKENKIKAGKIRKIMIKKTKTVSVKEPDERPESIYEKLKKNM